MDLKSGRARWIGIRMSGRMLREPIIILQMGGESEDLH